MTTSRMLAAVLLVAMSAGCIDSSSQSRSAGDSATVPATAAFVPFPEQLFSPTQEVVVAREVPRWTFGHGAVFEGRLEAAGWVLFLAEIDGDPQRFSFTTETRISPLSPAPEDAVVLMTRPTLIESGATLLPFATTTVWYPRESDSFERTRVASGSTPRAFSHLVAFVLATVPVDIRMAIEGSGGDHLPPFASGSGVAYLDEGRADGPRTTLMVDATSLRPGIEAVVYMRSAAASPVGDIVSREQRDSEVSFSDGTRFNHAGTPTANGHVLWGTVAGGGGNIRGHFDSVGTHAEARSWILWAPPIPTGALPLSLGTPGFFGGYLASEAGETVVSLSRYSSTDG